MAMLRHITISASQSLLARITVVCGNQSNTCWLLDVPDGYVMINGAYLTAYAAWCILHVHVRPATRGSPMQDESLATGC